MHDDDDIPWDAAGQLEVLTFDLHGESFALEAGIVQEILDLLPETPVPGSPRMVAGVVNFRGKVIPLADLRIAFGMPTAAPTIDSRIVVITFDLDGEATLVGLKADKVHEVAALTKAASEAPPRIGMRWRQDYIRLLVKRGEDLFVLPNLARIFAAARDPTDPGAAPASLHP